METRSLLLGTDWARSFAQEVKSLIERMPMVIDRISIYHSLNRESGL
jgi:hypothetical protein